MSEAFTRIIDFFEALSPESVNRFGEFYTADAYFKDPFNEVRGLDDIQRIFRHMYVALESPHFVVTARVVDGNQCFLTWDFKFRFRAYSPGQDQVIRGTTHLKLASDGRIEFHRDYWDAAEEL